MPYKPCANTHTTPILNFRSPFCSVEQKNNYDGYGRKWSGTERRSEAETQTRYVRILSSEGTAPISAYTYAKKLASH